MDDTLIAMAGDPRQVDGETPDRPHLTNSRPLVWDRVAATSRAAAALDDLLQNLEAVEATAGGRKRRRRANDRARLRAILEAVALDLFANALERPERFLAYSRRDEDYVRRRRYAHPQATCTAVKTAADLLVAAGYAEGRAGSYRRLDYGFAQAGRGYRSRLRATDALVAFFGERHGLTLEDLGLSREAELVRLKDRSRTQHGVKPLIDYEETERTRRMREDLHLWAEVAARHDIRWAGDRSAVEEPGNADDVDGAGEVVGYGECRLYRVFNNGRWDHRGRFYGGWWMALSKTERRGITIDGEPTVELDFSALHPGCAITSKASRGRLTTIPTTSRASRRPRATWSRSPS